MLKSRAPSAIRKKKASAPSAGQSRAIQNLKRNVRVLMMDREIKNIDTIKTATTASTVGTILSDTLNAPTQGDDTNSRDGRQIICKSLYLKGRVTKAKHATIDSDSCRVVVYWDRQPNGAATTISQLFSSADIDCHVNPLFNQRFVILSNKVYDLNSGGWDGTTSFEVNESFDLFIPLKDIPVTFKTNVGTVADCETNNFGVAAFSENGLVTVQYNCRLKFTD